MNFREKLEQEKNELTAIIEVAEEMKSKIINLLDKLDNQEFIEMEKRFEVWKWKINLSWKKSLVILAIS